MNKSVSDRVTEYYHTGKFEIVPGDLTLAAIAAGIDEPTGFEGDEYRTTYYCVPSSDTRRDPLIWKPVTDDTDAMHLACAIPLLTVRPVADDMPATRLSIFVQAVIIGNLLTIRLNK